MVLKILLSSILENLLCGSVIHWDSVDNGISIFHEL